jgi:hypothetical protein
MVSYFLLYCWSKIKNISILSRGEFPPLPPFFIIRKEILRKGAREFSPLIRGNVPLSEEGR